MKKIAVLGCGLIGNVIARDLASDPDIAVTVFDRSEEALARLAAVPRIATAAADLSSADSIRRAVAPADVVVGAVPGFLGRNMLKAVIAAGKPIADISFAPEDPLDLDADARAAGVTAVVDCGVSPGLSNFAAGRAAARLDEIESLAIYVGGLPVVRRWPYEYAIVFSATDVIEEYTRPARVIENGRLVVKPALSEIEKLDFEHVGTLEAFLTDGLRTVLSTVPARNMKEKTMRYPGHAELMRAFRETGFFGEEPVEVRGGRVAPRDLTERLLFAAWKLPAGQAEVTVLRVVVEGSRNGRSERQVFDLLDRTDEATGTTSMARTTGFPCAIVARMLASGEFADPGIRALEHLGRSEAASARLVADLRARGVEWKERTETIG
jgi:saccharopine dehydrogenase-like NADP-dependent oxidoreductase